MAAAVALKHFEPPREDAETHDIVLLLLRYTYMLLLVLVGWRLLVADMLLSPNNRHLVVSSGFFVGILLNAFLFKAEVLAPRANYAVRMAVYYLGCLCLAASPNFARQQEAKRGD